MEKGKSSQSKKVRKVGLRVKVLVPSIVIIMAIVGVMGTVSYYQMRNELESVAVEEAQVFAEMTVNIIDAEQVAQLKPGDDDSEIYQTLVEELRKIKQEYSIAYLFSLYSDGNNAYYGLDTDETETHCHIGDEFEKPYESVEKAFQGEKVVAQEISYYGTQPIISAYIPIKLADGTVVGVMGCDYDATKILERISSRRNFSITLGTIMEIISAVVMTLIIGSMLNALKKVNAKIYDIVNNEGDLTQHLDITTGDELELIATNVNSLISYIREIMKKISENAHTLEISSRNVAKSLDETGESVTDVSATMEEMSAAMEETAASLNQISETTQQVFLQVESIYTEAENGRSFSEQMKEAAIEIKNNALHSKEDASVRAQNMANAVNEKIEKSKAVEQIGELTANIIEITTQTNLLALNASIEAARAGEAGKGFAVVAEEIGKLAGNSAQAAEQIKQVSTAVIQAVNELAKEAAVMIEFMEHTAMNGYQKLMETSEDYQNNVGTMYKLMADFSQNADSLKVSMKNIAEAISTVDVAIEESTKGVVSVSETSVAITGNVTDIEGEAENNMEIAKELNNQVNKFKLE